MTDKELQALAEELSTLSRENNGDRIKAIEFAITGYELGLLKNNGGKAYFPLLKRHNNAIPYEAFYDILIDALVYLLKKYDPAKKAKFATVLANLLNQRVNNYWKKHYKERAVDNFSDLQKTSNEREEQEFEVADDTYRADTLLCEMNEFDIFLLVAQLVALRKSQEEHLSKSKKSYFEGFLTFDTTAQTKESLFDSKAVMAENDLLFPIMEYIVLEYLLEGQFSSMYDIVANAVKDPKRLKQRSEAIQKCYGLAGPTVVARNKLYRQLFNSVRT